MTVTHPLGHTEHMREIRQISIEEATRNIAEVIAQAKAGQEFAITEDGQPVLLLHHLDPQEQKLLELIQAGTVPPDVLERQQNLLKWLNENPAPPLEPGEEPLSETLIKMRREERF